MRTLVPNVLCQAADGRIVNTASGAGLVASAFIGSYNVSKYGVVALSECLSRELAQIGASIRVSMRKPRQSSTGGAVRGGPPMAQV
jgi:NAD(P)-dependent dehydrogenase (short-subunit alcohol dehydrogenase family)